MDHKSVYVYIQVIKEIVDHIDCMMYLVLGPDSY